MLDLEKVEANIQRLMDETMRLTDERVRVSTEPPWKSFVYPLAFSLFGFAIAYVVVRMLG